MIAYNFNEIVAFQLSEQGRKLLADYVDNFKTKFGLNDESIKRFANGYQPDCNGFYRMQMHEMMKIFGSELRLGQEVFLFGLIYFDEKYLMNEQKTADYIRH